MALRSRPTTATGIDAEWRWLRHAKTRVVLGDVPPLAFEAAAEAGDPERGPRELLLGLGLSASRGAGPGWASAASCGGGGVRPLRPALKLPFAGDLSAFRKVVDIPLVARRPRVPRAEVRRRLGLGAAPIALVSFGGIGLPGFDPGVLGGVLDVEFVMVGPMRPSPSNVRIFEDTALKAFGLGFEDLVGGADVVVTKPGYGIVTDAIGAGTRIVYTERGDFPEYEVLVAGMQALIPCAHVSNADLLAGRLGAPIRSVLEHPVPPPPDLSGASVAAEQLLSLVS